MPNVKSPHVRRLLAVRDWTRGGPHPSYVSLRIVEKKKLIVLYRHLSDLVAGVRDRPYTAVLTAAGRAALGLDQ